MLKNDTEYRIDHAVTDDKIGDEIAARLEVSSTPADAAAAQAILDLLDPTRNSAISERLFTALAGDGNGAAGKEIAKKLNGMVNVLQAKADGTEIAGVAEITSITPVAEGSAKEITEIEVTADVAGSLDGKYFILEDSAGTVAFWIDVDDSGTAEPAHGADRSVEITTIATGDLKATVGTAVYNAVIADSEFEAGSDNLAGIILVQNVDYGPMTAQAAGDSGFTVLENTPGSLSAVDGKYFVLQDKDGSVAFWIDVDDSGTAEPAHGADRSVEITTISSEDSAATIAGLLITAIGADSQYSAAAGVGNEVLATDAEDGARSAASAGDSGFTVAQDTAGVTAADTNVDPAQAAMGDEPMSDSVFFSLVHALTSREAAEDFRTAYNAMIAAIQAIPNS